MRAMCATCWRNSAPLSDGRIELQVFDPEPFTDAEDRADSFGLRGLPVDRTGERVFFGLAGTNSTDDVELIPFFDEARERDPRIRYRTHRPQPRQSPNGPLSD